MFLQNVGIFLQIHTALQLRRSILTIIQMSDNDKIMSSYLHNTDTTYHSTSYAIRKQDINHGSYYTSVLQINEHYIIMFLNIN
jgi:hypothetical protein